jgi:release factor glutamine methyltransferase
VSDPSPTSTPNPRSGGADGNVGGTDTSADTSGSTREKTWTVLELLKWTTDYFGRSGIESARLDAEVLLAHALTIPRLRLYIDYEKPVLPEERDAYRSLVQRRAQERVPVSQLLGTREFWSLEFKVSSDVLTPRPETETLVEYGLSKATMETPASGPSTTPRILDLGTGSGAIALSLASELPHAVVTATDLSKRALQIAHLNADQLHMSERIRFLEGDLFAPVVSERFDLIVSNPPYVARSDEGSLPKELSHEPEMALFSGPDGLDVIRRLVTEAGDHLTPGGWLGIELSPEQADEVERELTQAGFVDVERRFDLASRARVIGARWPKEG